MHGYIVPVRSFFCQAGWACRGEKGGIRQVLHAQIDFRRAHEGEVGVVERLEYDPNRSTRIALVRYPEGAPHACHLSEGQQASGQPPCRHLMPATSATTIRLQGTLPAGSPCLPPQ
jgi:large subunit ribosomal protein L2